MSVPCASNEYTSKRCTLLGVVLDDHSPRLHSNSLYLTVQQRPPDCALPQKKSNSYVVSSREATREEVENRRDPLFFKNDGERRGVVSVARYL